MLISGRGSNLLNLLQHAQAADFPAQISLVISNVANAAGIEHAKHYNVPFLVIEHKNYASKELFDAAINAALQVANIDFVVLAGFMRLLGGQFTKQWTGRLINIHPSLLPAFKGRDPQACALATGVHYSGCTVHFVTEQMDSGAIIGQAVVRIYPGDTPHILAARILKAEHILYPKVVALLCSGKIKLLNDKTIYENGAWQNIILAFCGN